MFRYTYRANNRKSGLQLEIGIDVGTDRSVGHENTWVSGAGLAIFSQFTAWNQSGMNESQRAEITFHVYAAFHEQTV